MIRWRSLQLRPWGLLRGLHSTARAGDGLSNTAMIAFAVLATKKQQSVKSTVLASQPRYRTMKCFVPSAQRRMLRPRQAAQYTPAPRCLQCFHRDFKQLQGRMPVSANRQPSLWDTAANPAVPGDIARAAAPSRLFPAARY